MRIAILGAMVEACDTASFTLFNRMSPAAVLSSALLHAMVAAAFLLSALPGSHPRGVPASAIELTVDLPAPPPSRPALAMAPPMIPDDHGVAVDPSPPAPRQAESERVLPAVEAPPSPVRTHDLAAIAPRAEAKPVPPARPAGSGNIHGATRPAPRLAIDAGRDFSLRQAREDYLRQLVRKLSHSRFAQDSLESTHGLVVARLTVARDGRLVGESLMKSSGFPDLDRGVMKAIRQASPFAPLPADLARDQYTFVVPINYVRDR